MSDEAGDDELEPWSFLQRSAEASPPQPTPAVTLPGFLKAFLPSTKPNPSPKSEPTKIDRLKQRAVFVVLDVLGSLTWAYVALKLLVFDVDRVLVERLSPSAAWVLDYRVFFVLLFIAALGLFLWNRWAVLLLFYVLFFPVVVVFWKLPNLVRRFRLYRSWLFWMLFLQAAIAGFRNLRFMLVASSLGLLCALVIVLVDQRPILAIAGGGVLLLLLVTAIRVGWNSLSPDWFLKSQSKALDWVGRVTTSSIDSWKTQAMGRKRDALLDRTQIGSLASSIWMGAVANQALYLWAYKLQQYRQSSVGIVMNLAAFATLFVVSIFGLGFANMALLKVDPSQYAFAAMPSFAALMVYGFSTMIRSEGGGIVAAGEWAYWLQIVSGVYGVLLLGVILTSALLSIQGARNDEELKSTVAEFRSRARSHEAELRAVLRVGIEEALERFRLMGFESIQGIYEYFKRNVPADFVADGPDGVG